MSLCLGTEGSGRFAAFSEKSDLCLGRLPAKDFVAMRKAAKALDDLDIRSPVAAQSTTTIGVARQSTEQRDRAVLVGEILAVVIWHVEKPPPHLRNQSVEPASERPVGRSARCGVARIGAWRAAEDVARDLVEQQHQGQGTLGQSLPRAQFAGGAG